MRLTSGGSLGYSNNLYSPGTAHCRNGYIDGQDKKTNLRNIFDDSIIARILDYYGEVKTMIIIENKVLT